MFKKVAIALLCALIMGFFFQNCSKGVSFDSQASDSTNSEKGEQIPPIESPENTPIDEESSLCFNGDNPENCYANNGLMGSLYYLTVEKHQAMFNDNLRNARLKDYRDEGIKVPVNVVMPQIDLPPQSFQNGFQLSNGDYLKTEAGVKLVEWFHLDLNGYINLPQGDYQFGTLSDDGIRITLDHNVVIENDTTHGPTFNCSGLIHFNSDEFKRIRVEYHQGPATQIAMQLFFRPASEMHKACDKINNIIPAEALKQISNL